MRTSKSNSGSSTPNKDLEEQSSLLVQTEAVAEKPPFDWWLVFAVPILAVQNALTVCLMRWVRTQPGEGQFDPKMAVLMQECLKGITGIYITKFIEKNNVLPEKHTVSSYLELGKIAIPAITLNILSIPPMFVHIV